ncbi:MAG TPA: ABC transporter substrate-binding protein [Pseudomonadota bacterium]|nr:ABC transporter substrate-binding protein [Pseudomonadota bacterium]HNO67978.1 ABC transporter substrate-binding protein [Pseudomonadota bacterium]
MTTRTWRRLLDTVRFRSVMLVGLLLFAWLPCSRAAYPVTVSDGQGRPVVLAKKPQRIVVLGPALYAYMLVDLGAADRVVGITQSADNPLEMQSLPSLGQPLSPDLERIVKLAPDLVLGGTDTVQKQLLSLSIPCYAGGRAGAGIVSSQDVFALVRAVGQLVFGDGVAAEKLIEKTRAEMSFVESKLAGAARSRVAVLYAGPRGNLYAAGAETPEDELVLRSVGENVFGHLRHHKPVSIEELLRQQPDVILIDQSQLPLLASQSVLRSVPAVRNGQVFGINAAVHGSSRLGLALRTYAQRIHPRAFGP